MGSHGLPRVARVQNTNKERKLIDDYRSLVDDVTSKIRAKEYSTQTLALTSTLLEKNPEYYTIWNHRRLIISSQTASGQDTYALITAELTFLIPLLKEFPKCYWIWNYRLWLLELSASTLPREQTLSVWKDELGLVGTMLTRDARNFHGWGYRRRIVEEIEKLSGTSLVQQEFDYTTQMIRRALENFSALHYRSKLIPRMLDESNSDGKERRKLIEQELDLMQNALIDPYNQSAWFYHRFLMQTIKQRTLSTDLSLEEQVTYYTQEIDRILDMLEDFEGCKWIWQALLDYTRDLEVLRGDQQQQEHVPQWLAQLRQLDPLRAGRWKELGQSTGS